MIYWSGFKFNQWDTLTESGWYYFDLDGTPTFRGGLYSSLKYENLQYYLPLEVFYENLSYDNFDVGSGYALVTDLLSTTTKVGRLYKDSGVGYYSGVFQHTFDFVNYLPVNQYGLCDIWALSNTIDNENTWSNSSAQAVRLALSNGKLSLRSHENGNYYNSTYSLGSGVQYSVRMTRDDTALTAGLYDNPVYSGTALDNLSLTLPISRNYRYFWACNKPNYGSTNTGKVNYLVKNYNLENNDWQGVMQPIVGLGDTSQISGASTFEGLLTMMMALEGSTSGYTTFGGTLNLIFSSGLDLYIEGMQQTTDYIPLWISGANYSIAGSLPLYIGASGSTSYLYLYVRGLGTNNGYYPYSDYIPLFIGNPLSVGMESSLPLYLHCAQATLSGNLPLYLAGSSPSSSGLDLFISGVGLIDNNMVLYTHGY